MIPGMNQTIQMVVGMKAMILGYMIIIIIMEMTTITGMIAIMTLMMKTTLGMIVMTHGTTVLLLGMAIIGIMNTQIQATTLGMTLIIMMLGKMVLIIMNPMIATGIGLISKKIKKNKRLMILTILIPIQLP